MHICMHASICSWDSQKQRLCYLPCVQLRAAAQSTTKPANAAPGAVSTAAHATTATALSPSAGTLPSSAATQSLPATPATALKP